MFFIISHNTIMFKKIYTVIIISLTSVLLSSCASMEASDNLYRSSEVGRAKVLLSCRVLASRKITIRSDHSGDKGETLGFITGLAASNSRNPVVNIIGGLVGGAVGRKVGDKLHNMPGVEYTVILSSGEERSLVQNLRKGERMLAPKTPCRLQVSGSYNRVLSSGHLPSKVKKPTKVKFSN